MAHAVNDDKFRLLVDGKDTPIVSTYSANAGVFEVPAQFEMSVGHTGLLTELLHNYCEYTPFELFVNDVKVMEGEIDELTGPQGNATQLKIVGLDRLARLTSTELDSDRSFAEVSFADLTEIALAEVGLRNVSVVSSNLANRKAITGKSKVTETVKPTEESTETELAETVQKRTKTVLNSLVIEAGTTWWDFLSTQYARGGLFLWADVFGGFVLGQPNGKQEPICRLIRRRGGSGEAGEVTFLGQPEFRRCTRQRYSEFHVQGRKGSGADGRGFAQDTVFDPEMIALLNPLEADRANGGKRKKVKIYRDDKIKAPAQATFLALRKMAESRRNGLSLSYNVSGHTVSAISGGGRLVWQPDTVVHVVDEELGIDGPMYLESCSYARAPKSTTRLSLMRCEDLLFGEEDLLNPPRLASKKGLVRMGRTEVFRPKWTKNPNWGGLPTLSDPNGFDSDRIITPEGIVGADGSPRR
jgi:hypothetical protein